MDELTDPGAHLSIDVTVEAEGVAVIAIAGEIDINTVARVRGAVARAAALDAARIVFDLSAVEFMDSSGIAALIEARSSADSIWLRRPSTVVQRLLVTIGLTDTLPVER